MKQVHPDTSILADASRFIDKLLNDFLVKIRDSFPFEQNNKTKEIMFEILSEILTGELSKHAIIESRKAVDRFNA